MRPNEHIVIEYYEANTHEDDYENGEGAHASFWTSHDIPVRGRFRTVREALKAITDANCLDWDRNAWTYAADDFGPEEAGRFDFCASVNENNLDATPEEIELWKAGHAKLYTLDINAYLSVRAERPLTLAECAI